MSPSSPATAPVRVVPDDVIQEDETLGTKPKFWFQDEAGPRRLFKRAARPGEDWSEWLAAEAAAGLGVQAAQVELAVHRGRRGTVSTSFLGPGEELFHGNELLLAVRPDYPTAQIRKVFAHTVEAGLEALARAGAIGPDGAPAEDAFVGYLLLDALVGNTDRHHENWAVLRRGGRIRLAPSYDHAASLGWNLPEAKVRLRLAGRDGRTTVDTYCRRARSAFYPATGGTRPLHPVDAFLTAARLRPEAGAFWRERAEGFDVDRFRSVIARLPSDRISEPHRAFAARMIGCNRARLLERRGAR